MYDVIIVGAGPAGLFAADRLVRENLSVLVVDERKYAGGSAINDGKLNLTHKIGMYFDELGIAEEDAQELIDLVDARILGLGAENILYGTDYDAITPWVKKAAEFNVELIPAQQRHMGTNNASKIWKRMYADLKIKGVNFLFQKKITDIENSDGHFSVISEDGSYKSKCIIVAPGRGGSYWFREQARKLGINTLYGPIDVGVRVEVPFEVYQPITDVLYDPKFIFRTHCHGDRTRAFCTNPKGFVTFEPRENAVIYDGIQALPLNGHARTDKKSQNTNLAILHTIQLTEPDQDTTELGRSSVISCYNLGGGKPLVQRLGDLLDGRRSKEKTFSNGRARIVAPTLLVPQRATPGDISLAYNGRTMDNIRETLIVLDKIVPGVAHPSTILYAPEAKFYDTKYQTESMQTTIPGLFVAGDGSGKSRGIIGAALTGILAAEGILKHT